MKSRVAKIFRQLTLCALSLAACACSEDGEDRGEDIWDFCNYSVWFTVTDASTGADLLAADNPSGIWLDGVSVEYMGERYTLASGISPAVNAPLSPALRQRPIITETGDVRNALCFGEFSPEEDYHGRTFAVDWGDGTRTEVSFDCYITWNGSDPTVHQRVWVDGREQREDAVWHVDIVRTLPEPTFDADYCSKDYSADGSVVVLQRASEGRGVDIVVMGDGYSDRLVANGVYLRKMRQAVEAFFSEEPYRSLRHLFNVYAVNVVSPAECIGQGGQTALGVGFGEGTVIYGDYDACFGYVWNIDDLCGRYERLNELTVLVMVNQIRWAGTCYMWGPYSLEDGETMLDGDYGRGFSIAYSCYVSADDLRYTIVHEGAGHGFAKLADEYFSADCPVSDYQREYETSMQPYGYFRNIDYSGDVVCSPWYLYTVDPRYEGSDVGYFEGASYCDRGIWRSSWQSLMFYTAGGFNPVSREAAYRRINRLSRGASWRFDYEEFVTFDMEHRCDGADIAPVPAAHADRMPLPHPVMMDRSGGGLRR